MEIFDMEQIALESQEAVALDSEMKELNELQLCLVGGGIGEVIVA